MDAKRLFNSYLAARTIFYWRRRTRMGEAEKMVRGAASRKV
jgi:hypothetical protein